MEKKTTLRLLIAEDYEWARLGLTIALQERCTHTVVGQAENGERAVELSRQELPDIVLMDLSLPVMDGVQATREIKSVLPKTKVVILASQYRLEDVNESLAAGADGYCLKNIQTDRLIQVLEMVSQGAIWLDPGVGALLPSIVADRSTSYKYTHRSRERYNEQLTKREAEVLDLITRGKSNKEIAHMLSISNHTVKIHVSRVIQKMNVDDRTQVVIKAIQKGMVDVKMATTD